MTRMRSLAALGILLVTVISLPASAQQGARKSVIVLHEPAELPATVVEPGTYVFKAEDTVGSGRTNGQIRVEMWNQDESQLLTSFIALADGRPGPDNIPGLSFYAGAELESGPRVIQSWSAADQTSSYQFVYPKARAREIARETGLPVVAAGSTAGAIVAIAANGAESPLPQALVKPEPGR